MKIPSRLRAVLVVAVCLSLVATVLRAAETAPAPAAKGALPRLVEVGADKCIPCKMMAPILAELRKEYAGQLDIAFIDVWKNREEGERYGVRIIPTQIFYDATGRELFRHEGFFAKNDILAKWRELGVGLKKPAGDKSS